MHEIRTHMQHVPWYYDIVELKVKRLLMINNVLGEGEILHLFVSLQMV